MDNSEGTEALAVVVKRGPAASEADNLRLNDDWSGRGCDVLSHLDCKRRSKGLRLLGRRPCVQVTARGGKRAVAHRLLDRHDIDPAHRQQRAERMA